MNKEVEDVILEVAKVFMPGADARLDSAGMGLRETLFSGTRGEQTILACCIFEEVAPVMFQILDDVESPILELLVRCTKVGINPSLAMAMFKVGIKNQVWTMGDRRLRLTPKGRRLTIKAVRAIGRLITVEPEFKNDPIGEWVNPLLKKVELELV